MKIILSADSSIDLNEELLKKFNIETIAFPLVVGDNLFQDGQETTDKLFELANQLKTLPKTGAINEFAYEEYFKSLLSKGDAVIHFSLSSRLSSSSENAYKAALKLDNVYVIDTLNGSTAIALLILYTQKLIAENKPIKEILQSVNQRLSAVQIRFLISKVDFLYRGGRCSKLQLLGANLLKIRPVVMVRDGEVKCDKKYRGRLDEAVINHFADSLAANPNLDFENAFISYSTCENHNIIEAAVKLLKEKGFKNVYVSQMNGTISSHLGPNSFGIIFFNDGNKN